MTTEAVIVNIKNLLNKLDSKDYDNIENWQIVNAFNIAQILWVRRQFHGNNLMREGDEASLIRIDDLQILVKKQKLSFVDKGSFIQTYPLPSDYLFFKRLDLDAESKCCSKDKTMIAYMVKESDVNLALANSLYKPSFEWGETIFTISEGRLKIFKEDDVKFKNVYLTYYRYPKRISLQNTFDIETGSVSTISQNPEWKDDICYLIIHEAAKLLSMGLEHINAIMLNNNVEQVNN